MKAPPHTVLTVRLASRLTRPGYAMKKKVAGLEGGRVSGNQSAGRTYGARQGPLNVTKAAIGTAATGG